jgi:hypothetical protein
MPKHLEVRFTNILMELLVYLRPKIEVKMLFSSTGQFLSKSAAIFAIFDVFYPELQYI